MTQKNEFADHDIYVVVSMNDKPRPMPSGRVYHDDGGPIVWETYTRGATRENAEKRAKSIGVARYGETRIAKLVFEEDQPNEQ